MDKEESTMGSFPCITHRIRVYGIVQGVGFRPTVSRHGTTSGIHGTVCNFGPYVEIFAQGRTSQVEYFEKLLVEQPPKRAAILKVDIKDAENAPSFPDFQIIESGKTSGEIFISPDIAICEECKKEMYTPGNRRYRHPFINCTCCGPRLTILDALPYDRERTSMKEFPMCPSCASEYYSPETRRYDAQPVCCNACGPRVSILPEEGEPALYDLEAIRHARRIIAQGGIVAIKGIGGFHLCCDATNPAAVELLRSRKRRPTKPFAVMMRDIETVRRECITDELKEEILTGHQKPILLLERREEDGDSGISKIMEMAGPNRYISDTTEAAASNWCISDNTEAAASNRCISKIAESVAPGNPKLGVMLPYAPIHMLLFHLPSKEDPQVEEDGILMPDCLVMTSGNISGAPICRDDRDANTELRHICDAILTHDRQIRIRADDTVMDIFEDHPYMIRRSRGYAPLPFLTARPMKGQVLAMGGELKNSFCIGTNGLFYPSPYVGDLGDYRTVQALKETVERFMTLLEVKPQAVACDLHPRYNSTQAALDMGLPVVQVQHHYAHILSCMAENDSLDPVIGVSFDGTGYGTDGTIWGGEILDCDVHGFRRIGHIHPFLQIGGDISAREGWRIAVSMIYDILRDKAETEAFAEKLKLCDSKNVKVQMMMADRKINTVTSTSAGRLFDAVSSILGICHTSGFEGEASTQLMFAAQKWGKEHPGEASRIMAESFMGGKEERGSGSDDGKVTEDSVYLLSTKELVAELLTCRLRGENVGYLAWRFHQTLALQIRDACIWAREKNGREKVALSGGVFQNLLLVEMTAKLLREAGFEVLLHSMVPPNDGGIGLGQALYAMENLPE